MTAARQGGRTDFYHATRVTTQHTEGAERRLRVVLDVLRVLGGEIRKLRVEVPAPALAA